MYSKPRQDEIKIYSLNYKTISNEIFSLKDNITPPEISIVNKFKYEKDKSRYIIARSFLRKILSNILGINPLDIIISTNKFGKPVLDHKKYSNIKFNLSHSGDIIVYAFSLFNEIGVDIEEIKDIPEFDELSRAHFSDEEQSIYFELKNPDEKKQLFYKIWTRKEALLKAAGSGITIDLRSLTVLRTNERNATQIKVKFSNKDYLISDIPLDINYASSVAMDSHSYKEILVYDKDFTLLKKI